MSVYKQSIAGVISILLGVAVGSLWNSKEDQSVERTVTPESAYLKSTRAPSRVYQDLPDYLTQNFSYLEDIDRFDTQISSMHLDSLSPIRVEAVTTAFIQNGSFDHWHDRIKKGEIKEKDLIQMVAAHLVREDTARAMKLMLDGAYQFESFGDLWAFATAIGEESAIVDPNAAFQELHKKKANLHRQTLAHFVSDTLANEDPGFAAENFSEILELRDNGKKGNDEFTQTLLESWMKRDSKSAEDFIQQLPEGSQRELFNDAYERIIAAKKDSD